MFQALGFSNTNWSGGTLPVALALLHPAGGAGCQLLVNNVANVLLVNGGGPLQTTITLPNDPAFAGFHMYQQVLEEKAVKN